MLPFSAIAFSTRACVIESLWKISASQLKTTKFYVERMQNNQCGSKEVGKENRETKKKIARKKEGEKAGEKTRCGPKRKQKTCIYVFKNPATPNYWYLLKFVWLANNKITTAKEEKNKQQNFSWLNKIQTKVQITAAAAATTTKQNQTKPKPLN